MASDGPFFLLPNDITTGGVPGIASIVYWATGFPVQYTYFSINFFLLLLALKLLGLKFCIKTIFGVFTLTFFLSVIQQLASGVSLLRDQPFMACVIGASFCGGGIGVAFCAKRKHRRYGRHCRHHQQIPGHNLRKSHTDLRYDYYFFQLFCSKRLGKSSVWVCNTLHLQFRPRSGSEQRTSVCPVFIISNKYEEIGRHINEYPHRGVTIINATGFYTGREVKMMFVLAKKRESPIIFRLIKDIDPNAFVSQSAVIGVYGEGFDHIKVK